CALPWYCSSSFRRSGAHPDLHSFPTRRSSDLDQSKIAASVPAAAPFHEPGVMVIRNVNWAGTRALYAKEVRRFMKVQLQTIWARSEEHTSELQSRENLVCRLLLEKKKATTYLT